MGKPEIDRLSRDLAPALERGFRLEPLGTLRREGHEVHLWKLDLGAAEDEYLLQLALKDGRAAGFWVR
jgi:hypothetical protein